MLSLNHVILLSLYYHIQAAIAWTANAPPSIEEIEVDPTKAGEVRINVNINETFSRCGCGYMCL
uniref:Uncharacterized protein n=1 Tax=Balaenoptera musculus TaxID=9771 RepID=A0A8C0C6I7_BALMU